MSLDYYIEAFKQLSVNRSGGHPSPHKVCMLLAVTDLIESVDIYENRIVYGDKLLQRYVYHFDRLRTHPDQANPHLPFFHLRSESFWHHAPFNADEYNTVNQIGSQGQLVRIIRYSCLDDELFLLLGQEYPRNRLRAALLNNLDDQPKDDGWSWLECEQVVDDYLTMFFKELRGERYDKTSHRRTLQPKLNGRSEGAIEYKHQNISAVLIDLGYPYIKGYKPAFNYQQRLKQALLARLGLNQNALASLAADLAAPEPPPRLDHWKAHVEAPPELEDLSPDRATKTFQPRYYNFIDQESANKRLGELGEKWVLEFEQQRLIDNGRADLAHEIEWTAKKKGDGAGYDIRSFDIERDAEMFIEVKTTNSGKYQPFYITENEVDFSRSYADQYSLYRVFQFKQSPKAFMLPGTITEHIHLLAQQYKAVFR